MQQSGEFPNDDNGDVLRKLQGNGDDLTQARDINFTVVFPDELAAQTFASEFRDAGYSVEVEMTHCRKELPWDVRVVRTMIPTYEGIGSFELELEKAASVYSGENEGWGCFSQTKVSN